MFEAVILLALLGIILLFIVTGERTGTTRRTTFIDLSAELRPSAGKPPKPTRVKKHS